MAPTCRSTRSGRLRKTIRGGNSHDVMPAKAGIQSGGRVFDAALDRGPPVDFLREALGVTKLSG